MRSSIACSRCRRSKVKCVNNGVNTTCRACENTGRECTYPSPALTGGQAHVARREGSAGKTDGPPGAPVQEAPRRPRPKKSIAAPVTSNSHSRDSIRALVDALDTSILTPKIWIELFEIYQAHFATDMPFLHPPTFLKPLRQAGAAVQTQAKDFSSSTNGPPAVLPPFSPLLLLAFLSLTARYHPTLVAHHSPPSASRPSNPRIASEYYAAAAKSRLAGNLGDGLGTPELERVQALLMLALFDWGNCQGQKAWVSVGVALRYAQILGLQYEEELDDQPMALSLAMRSEAEGVGARAANGRGWELSEKGDDFVEREIRRRTFWSCFIMDRYISSGKYRPQMINARDVRIQLPSSERAFLFGEKVRTLLLYEEVEDAASRADVDAHRRPADDYAHTNGEKRVSPTPRGSPAFQRIKQEMDEKDADKGRWEIGPDEGITSRFVKVLDLYGHIIKWSCSGGRSTERYAPWEPQSTFYQLRHEIDRFGTSLPRDMTLTSANISAHIHSRTSTPYTLLHATILLCNVMLHREYLPFVPLRCAKPCGPLDPPLFPEEKYVIPAGFWERSASTCFKSARELMDLMRTCQEWGVLVETPIVGFAIYVAAFAGVYAINFPWMDTNGYMSAGADGAANTGSADAARKALELIGQFRPRLKMADSWFKTIRRLHLYYLRIKQDFRRNIKALSASTPAQGVSSALPLREGGPGGGLEEWRIIERALKEFGRLEDEDLDMPDAPPEADLDDQHSKASVPERGMNDTGSPGSGPAKPQGWASINAVSSNAPNSVHRMSDASNTSAAAGTNGHYITAGSRPQQASGFSTPGLVSPTRQSIGTGASEIATPYGAPVAQAPVGTSGLSTVGYASVEDARNASMSLQQQVNAQPVQATDPMGSGAQQQPWTKEMEQSWLDSLETRFSGDDIAAFVEGGDWQDWAGMAANHPNPGWLSAVWG